MEFSFESVKKNIHLLKIKIKSVNDTVLTGHFSDIHFDSKYCHRDKLKKHLDYLKANNGLAFFYGDIFDVMGTFRDPRSKPQDIRTEYLTGGSYLDRIVEDAFNFFKPYKDIICLMSDGNHETNISRRHDTDILDRLCFLLRTEGGITQHGGYSGFIRVQLKYNTCSISNLIYYHHGKGGNAKRSKGILYSQLDAYMIPQADVILSGHDHNKLYDPSNVKMILTDRNEIIYKSSDWLKLGSYKRDDKNPGVSGWEVEKGFLPTKMSGWAIEFILKREKIENKDNRTIIRKIYQADCLI